MLVARRDPFHPGAHDASSSHGADVAGRAAPRLARTVNMLQVVGSLLAIPVAVIGNIFLGALYVSSQGRDGLLIADTPGPVGVSDLPSLADQISVNTEDVPPELGADLMAKPATGR